jgi:hypothetical protein
MGKLLYLLPQGCIGCIANARSPVRFTSGNSNQYVLLRPRAFRVCLPKLVERYLELLGPVLKSGDRIREL